MNPPRIRILAALALALPASAAVTEDFSAYRLGDSFSTGQTLGAEGLGWLGGWRTSSSHVNTVARVEDAAPLDAGPYLRATITSTQGGPNRPSGAISRPYTPPEKPFTLSFRFRPAHIEPELRYFLFDNDARAAGPGKTASWQIEIFNGQWRLIDGGGNGAAENYIDTGVPVVAGVAYAVTLSIDPARRLWSVTIAGGQRGVTQENLSFRTDAFTTERWIHFGAGELGSASLGITAEWSVDSILVRP